MSNLESTREQPLDLSPEIFRKIGYELVDQIAIFLDELSSLPVAPAADPPEIRNRLGNRSMPQNGVDAGQLLTNVVSLLKENSTFNGHPRFLGYITSSASPLGALADMLASAINSNVGAAALAPMATAIEQQTIRWLAELVDFPTEGGGLLVSGGNMANITAFWAARKAKATWDIRRDGVTGMKAEKLVAYTSTSVHTWIDKAADLSGLGLNSIRRIEVNKEGQLVTAALRRQIEADLAAGLTPFLVVGTAGTVELGVIDPLAEISEICGEFDLWFHIDGAYGAVAGILPEYSAALHGLSMADSVAIDPHKWLYAPLEAGALLMRDAGKLIDAFSFHPVYYNFDEESAQGLVNFYEYGPQNSRGFRALKVWLTLQQAGRGGYETMLRDDIAAAKHLYGLAERHPELEACTHHLSITTFRYVPKNMDAANPQNQIYLNNLNSELLSQLNRSGKAFISNAMLHGNFILRACVVNFRTTLKDMEAVAELVVKFGREMDKIMVAQAN